MPKASPTSMSLKHALKQRLINDMILPAKGDEDAIVLVLGPVTSRIFSSCCRMYDLMDVGVLAIENIQIKRESLDMSAVYFLAPTQDNINRILEDFSDGKHVQYSGTIHLYFTSHVTDELMAQLSTCTPLIKRMKTLEELNVDFLSVESHIYTLRTNLASAHTSTLQKLYWPSTREQQLEELRVQAKQLASLCVSLGQLPIVRFRSDSEICRTLATFVELELQQCKQRLQQWKYTTYQQDRNNVLLIVDRTLDPVAPLMHEFTYQAMINDLLPVNGEICYLPLTDKQKQKLQEEKEKEEKSNKRLQASVPTTSPPIVLSEDDSLWVQLRHQHIGAVMSSISEKFNEFRKQNRMVNIAKDIKKATIKDMLRAMQDAPEYKSIIQRYQKHMQLAEYCRMAFEAQQQDALGDLEQTIATSLTNTDEQKLVDWKQCKNDVIKFLANSQIRAVDKLRLAAVFLLATHATAIVGNSQLGSAHELRREFQSSFSTFHPALASTFSNCEKLKQLCHLPAAPTEKKAIQQLFKQEKPWIERLKQHNADSPFSLMRYQPELHTVMTSLVGRQLGEDDYITLSVVDEPTDAADEAVKAAPMQRTDSTGSNGRTKSNSVAAAAAPAAAGKSLRKKPAAVSAAAGKQDEAKRQNGSDSDSGDDGLHSDGGGSDEENQVGNANGAKKAAAKIVQPKARTIVFVAGGISYSEVRSCYEVNAATGANLVLGSTHIATPREYVRSICDRSMKSWNEALLQCGDSVDEVVAADPTANNDITLQVAR